MNSSTFFIPFYLVVASFMIPQAEPARTSNVVQAGFGISVGIGGGHSGRYHRGHYQRGYRGYYCNGGYCHHRPRYMRYHRNYRGYYCNGVRCTRPHHYRYAPYYNQDPYYFYRYPAHHNGYRGFHRHGWRRGVRW